MWRDWPAWHCPACSEGALGLVKDTIRQEETAASKRARSDDDWRPWEVSEQFSALLRCSRCKEPVFIVGAVSVTDLRDDEHGWYTAEVFAPSFFQPPSPVIRLPRKCPDTVKSEVLAASGLYWSSPPSAANRIRAALERLMDALDVAKKAKNKKGKFDALSLHARIERFHQKNAEVGGLLLAIKWLGNSGSHSSDLTSNDVLDAFELLEHALEEVYESKATRLKMLSASINKKKGPAKR